MRVMALSRVVTCRRASSRSNRYVPTTSSSITGFRLVRTVPPRPGP